MAMKTFSIHKLDLSFTYNTLFFGQKLDQIFDAIVHSSIAWLTLWWSIAVVVLDCDSAHGYEEDATDKVDEELQNGEIGADQVGDQHCWHDNGVTWKKKIFCMNQVTTALWRLYFFRNEDTKYK